MSDTITTPDVATQIAYPIRTMVRTFVQWFVGLALAFLLRKFALDLAGWSQQIVDVVTTIVWGLLTALATWVMTRPAVAKFLAGTILAAHPAGTPVTAPAPKPADPPDPVLPASTTANADGTVTSETGDGLPPTNYLS